jgi:hypothetical protein
MIIEAVTVGIRFCGPSRRALRAEVHAKNCAPRPRRVAHRAGPLLISQQQPFDAPPFSSLTAASPPAALPPPSSSRCLMSRVIVLNASSMLIEFLAEVSKKRMPC